MPLYTPLLSYPQDLVTIDLYGKRAFMIKDSSCGNDLGCCDELDADTSFLEGEKCWNTYHEEKVIWQQKQRF